MKSRDMIFWIWLSLALGAGSNAFRSLIALYGNAYDVFHAEEAELERIASLSERAKLALADKNLSQASEILDHCERTGIEILCYEDEQYPVALREIKNPPIVLYYRGVLPDFNQRLCVGMVGTRSMSAYGLRSAYKMSYELSCVNALVVSGMAKGIDGVSAAAALAAGGGTVAVLGSGVDVVYPTHHKPLYEAIIEKGGAVFSEYPPGTRPNSYHFPMRNRIISGMSQATVVVEAGIGSGSLITAKNAILQGREVFALPANVGSRGAEGTNGLLRDGAYLALSANDIIDHYRYVYAQTLRQERMPRAEAGVEGDLAYLASLGVVDVSSETLEKQRTARQGETKEPKLTSERSTQRTRRGGRKKVATENATRDEQQIVQSKPAVDEVSRNEKTPDEVVASLSQVQLAVLNAIPDDEAIPTDTICGIGYPYGEVIAALTMLEIMGLVQKLPGSLYKKA